VQLLQSTHDARISRMDAKEEVLPPLSSVNSSHAARLSHSCGAAFPCARQELASREMDLQREYTNKNLEEEHQRNRNRINSIAQYARRSHICAGTAGVLRSPEATHICAGRLLQLRRVCAGTSRAQRPKSRKRSRRMRATSARRSTAGCFSASGESRSEVAAEWPSWR
jgi:hypothetical protein